MSDIGVNDLRVSDLAADFVDRLRRGTPSERALHAAGEPEPGAAALAFGRAFADPDLKDCVDVWAPALLRSARPGAGARRLLELVEAARACGANLAACHQPALALVVGSSDFLGRLLVRRPAWANALDAALPDPPADPRTAGPPAAEWNAIRNAKYRGLLCVAARDLLGRPFAEGLRELSDLADGCLHAASACTANELGTPSPAVFALGKLGGRELNFSSDVDLLFLYDSPGGDDDLAQSQAAARFIRHMKKQLESPSAEGFVYRVDLGLRPEGSQGKLANSTTAALDYYEAFGAEWERQMLIRLRAVAGPEAVARDFEAGIQPFVYRRYIDPGVVDSVRAMKDRIELERRDAGRDLDGDLKEGPGGIRDVEFLVQAHQLFFGGRAAELRTGNTLDALALLSRLDMLPEQAASELTEAYTWLRRAEHAAQLAEERQTSQFPADAAGQLRMARRMGYDAALGADATAALVEDRAVKRALVRRHFEALVLERRE